MHLLILGGTGFLGARTVEHALARGHSLMLFTRGKTSAEHFAGDPRVAHLVGDRDPDVGAGLGALEELVRRAETPIDAVLDISGYLPRHVAASARLLAPHTPTYLFISSVSVYDAPTPVGVDEGGDLIRLADPTVEVIDGETYGGLKVLCEEFVRAAAGDATLIVRPGILMGPDDFTDRFSYWVWAADQQRGGELLCPDPGDPLQVLDASDLGLWLVELAERGARGVRAEHGHDTFNASGPPGSTTVAGLIAAILAGIESDARPAFVPRAFLAEHGVRPFADMPLWLPPVMDRAGILTADSSRARAAGLVCRPLEETARTTLEWLTADLGRRASKVPICGLSLERASEVLAAYCLAGGAGAALPLGTPDC